MDCESRSIADRRLSNFKISFNVRLIRVPAGMIDVQTDCLEPNLLSRNSSVDQTESKFAIQATVFHALVESVDGNDVRFPS